MKNTFRILVLCIALVAVACYRDKAELLYGTTSTGNSNCADADGTVSYKQKVAPLLQQYCYGCHGGNSPLGGIAMGSYETDKALGQNGKLYGSISHAAAFSPMPKGSAKLNDCQLATIKKWIDSGLADN